LICIPSAQNTTRLIETLELTLAAHAEPLMVPEIVAPAFGALHETDGAALAAIGAPAASETATARAFF
jgi:hypothetical protein